MKAEERMNFVLLVILCTINTCLSQDLLQGIPLGLTFGSIPFILKSKLNYTQLAIFSLSNYPYSLKLLYSPIVDSFFAKGYGRRKSWIVPVQFLIAIVLYYCGENIDETLAMDVVPVYRLATTFTFLVFLCATQDIAVDGWALTLLSDENRHYGSTAQTVGLNTGYFMSFTVFLALNSQEFCQSYLGSQDALINLGGYLRFWGLMFLLTSVYLHLFKTEKPEKMPVDGVMTTYKTLWKVMNLTHVKEFIMVMLVAKIGFIANENVTGLKLLEKGIKKQDLAFTVLLDFPLQLIFGYFAAKWSRGKRPLRPWLIAFYFRLLIAAISPLFVSILPNKVTPGYFAMVVTLTVLSSFTSTVQFVSIGSFFSFISDPRIGGTYMTLLNTISNLGGIWPKYFVLTSVDYLTKSTCSLSIPEYGTDCSKDVAKQLCENSYLNVTSNQIFNLDQVKSDLDMTVLVQGKCNVRGGYYLTSFICVGVGAVIFFAFIRKSVRKIESLKQSLWRLEDTKKK